jgi:hypothetical protein
LREEIVHPTSSVSVELLAFVVWRVDVLHVAPLTSDRIPLVWPFVSRGAANDASILHFAIRASSASRTRGCSSESRKIMHGCAAFCSCSCPALNPSRQEGRCSLYVGTSPLA